MKNQSFLPSFVQGEVGEELLGFRGGEEGQPPWMEGGQEHCHTS